MITTDQFVAEVERQNVVYVAIDEGPARSAVVTVAEGLDYLNGRREFVIYWPAVGPHRKQLEDLLNENDVEYEYRPSP